MAHGDVIDVEGVPLIFLEYPTYNEAHPGEAPEHDGDDAPCRMCAKARRQDTGETVLLWMCESKNWIVSRADPQYVKHRTELQVLSAQQQLAAPLPAA